MKTKVSVIEIDSPRYPALLKEINNPPPLLYYKGKWNDTLFKHCLAVVGSRKMTTYGRRITEQLVSEVARKGVTIVSGFMYGIDATAHHAAVEAGGKTIAVMPCGIDLIHPAYQKDLYNRILDAGGLIISEYTGASCPTLWTYPQRNRIVAGLSYAAMVVEAGEKSGSLITAQLTKKYERTLLAVPGPLTSSVSLGTAALIKEGANIVTCPGDILETFGIEEGWRCESALYNVRLNRLELSIVEKLKQEPMRIDSLSRSLGVSISKIGTAISLMQLKGLLFEEEGKYYVS